MVVGCTLRAGGADYRFHGFLFVVPVKKEIVRPADPHPAKGKRTADQIPLESLTGNAVVIDVSANALKNRDYLISIKDVQEWEQKNDSIAPQTIILFHTGYGQFYPDAKQYFGTDVKGAGAIPLLHFPGIDPTTAQWLVQQRKVKAVGIDTPSIDYGQSIRMRMLYLMIGMNGARL